MWRRRKTWIVVLAALVVGALAALWLDKSLWTTGPSPKMASSLEAEEERQRRKAMQAAAEKQLEDRRQAEARRIADEDRRQAEARRIEEEDRRQAEARRVAEEDRLRREAVILQALQKQKDAEAAARHRRQEVANLAAAERMLAQQHEANTDLARASELERLQREQKQAALMVQERERRLADTIRALEQERIRTASAVQASLRLRRDQEQKHVDASPNVALPSQIEAAKPAEPAAPARVAAAASRVPPAAKPSARTGRRSATRRTRVARTATCRSSRCRAPRTARRAPARTGRPAAHATVDLCPLRWLDAVLTDMHRRLSAHT